MTPKERAIELLIKMDMIIYTDQDLRSKCIRCAIRTVEEILQEVPTEILDTYKGETNFVDNERYDFWQNVKLELERL